jgi:phage terminase large subunit-like protein
VTVTNASTVRAPFTIGSLSAPFAQTSSCPTTLDAGASCDVTVTFKPTDVVAHAAALSLPGLSIPVSGTGGAITIATADAGRRWSDGTYAASCKDYRTSGGNYQYAGATGDGVYTIDTDGAGSQAPLNVYCDMTSDGGGWMLFSNIYRDASGSLNLMAGTNQAATLSPVSGSGTIGGTQGLNSFQTFPFTTTRIEFIAGDNPGQIATFYKGLTRANMASWAVVGAIEPDTSKAAVCTDYAMTQNCTSRPFDHDYNNDGSSTNFNMFWGVTVAKYGYTVTSYQPAHGVVFTTGGSGWCSTTSNANNNAWNDSYGDGHWGNGMRIWVK